MRRQDREPWNNNMRYHHVALAAVPPGCRNALDVGCGTGTLTRELRTMVPDVVGIDVDEPSIAVARRQDPASSINYIVGDALTGDLEPASFDLVASVAALHHMDATAGLTRLRDLVRPGGVVAVIGLARQTPLERPLDLAPLLPNYVRFLRGGYWEQTAPMVWPPPETYRTMRTIAGNVLPGAEFRRRFYWRYTLVWTKPTTS